MVRLGQGLTSFYRASVARVPPVAHVLRLHSPPGSDWTDVEVIRQAYQLAGDRFKANILRVRPDFYSSENARRRRLLRIGEVATAYDNLDGKLAKVDSEGRVRFYWRNPAGIVVSSSQV